MATLTIRHVPEAVVERLKAAAKRKGYSMEQEVRELLAMRRNPCDHKQRDVLSSSDMNNQLMFQIVSYIVLYGKGRVLCVP